MMYGFQETILVTRSYLPDFDAFMRRVGSTGGDLWPANNGSIQN